MNVSSSLGQINMTILGECLPNAKTSTIPFSEGEIMHHSKIAEVYKLRPRQTLGENVHNLLICGCVPELHYSLLHHVSGEVLQETFKATLLHGLQYWLLYTLPSLY